MPENYLCTYNLYLTHVIHTQRPLKPGCVCVSKDNYTPKVSEAVSLKVSVNYIMFVAPANQRGRKKALEQISLKAGVGRIKFNFGGSFYNRTISR